MSITSERVARKQRKPVRWGRLMACTAMLLIILLGAGLLAYNWMTDRVLVILADYELEAGPGWQTGKPGGASGVHRQRENYNPELTPEEAKRAKERVTLEEKLRLASVFLRHWSGEELKQFQSSLQDGLSLEEKRELKRKMLSRLDEEEYNELIAIAQKYGWSQGKEYEESLREQSSRER
ncbi:hypothetical protein [Paenibacillus abyssi]|uniref:Uncharacterized protein n=1 Tax=Paenibacillus abyssi TaxID=1340531 RepID=A0A917FSR3_9BACL|nr:hypothetical protein [Paenibacillus abyssi]GGF98481.1 hypothetical protein GCM10010916_14650 [Paenibacillus abyssi]